MEYIIINDGKCDECGEPATRLYKTDGLNARWMLFCDEHNHRSYALFRNDAIRETQSWYGPAWGEKQVLTEKNMTVIDYVVNNNINRQ